jgi:hypothetical protein
MRVIDSLPKRTIDTPAKDEPAAVDNPVWVIAFEIFFGLAMIAVVAVTWIKLLAPLFMEMLP